MVWLKDHWEPCQSEYASAFRGRTEKEIEVITQEINAQNKRTGTRRKINASLIARYLTDTRSTEKILLQRLRDQETHSEHPATSSPQEPVFSHSSINAKEDAFWSELESNLFGA